MTIERAFPVAGRDHPYREFECSPQPSPFPPIPMGRYCMGRMENARRDGHLMILYLRKPGGGVEPVVGVYGVFRDRDQPDWYVNWSEDPLDADQILGWAPLPGNVI